ncbi:MAG: rRNA pseudouridine synthase [SAR324 cluster bacterium]|nr:rRNA pseudouridine synthase [SAR324 cluster bacterium]
MTKQQTDEAGVRIQKVIASAGIASRRSAEKLIRAGLVTLNGEKTTLGQRMQVGRDELEVEGVVVYLPTRHKHVVYAFYKPKNCITSLNDPEGRSTIKDFFPETKQRLFPVGRLDYDAEGLLLLTNDGDFAQRVIHPRYQLWKTYFVKIKGLIRNDELHKLKKGCTFAGHRYLPAKVKILHSINNKTWLEVSLQEGKNQQIKKMFRKLGYSVQKIKRYSIDAITLGELEPGMSRLLSPGEIESLLRVSEKTTKNTS